MPADTEGGGVEVRIARGTSVDLDLNRKVPLSCTTCGGSDCNDSVGCCGVRKLDGLWWSCKKGHEVLIQGGVIDDVARHLVEQYGVPKRYIEILDKTKK
ncbi:unnamed protein product [Dovyalis caffra]|uniref:SUI1 domain-containing protein n=1 Tax=Dovyalis caffra TaxID=77055 RepID=A0AAV1S190_9ROSI|nr:unnamed protein product [Dovyalis caffra]